MVGCSTMTGSVLLTVSSFSSACLVWYVVGMVSKVSMIGAALEGVPGVVW